MAAGNPTEADRGGIRWGSLVRAAAAFVLVAGTGRLSLYLARWPEPVRYASLAALVIGLGLLVYGTFQAWLWIRTLSLRRAVVIVLVCYLLAVFIAGLTAPGQAVLPGSWLEAAARVPLEAGKAIYRGALAVVQFPGQFRAEYTGQTAPFSVGQGTTSTEQPVPANASVQPIQIKPPPGQSGAQALSLGSAATTTDQAGHLCMMDAFADGPFAPGSSVRLVEGPRYVDNELWWRVRGQEASGWCPGTALGP